MLCHGYPRIPPLATTLQRGMSLLLSAGVGRVQPSRSRSSPFDFLKDEGSCNGILSQANASGLLCVCQSLSQELDKHPGEKQINS